jgi:ubiquinol-cytochrome c reductase cytochrome c1 subunit
MSLRVALVLAAAFWAAGASAQHEVELEQANNNVKDPASLQRGARYFVNYCLGCHSAKYVRYNRVGEDLQLSDDQLQKYLMFTGEHPYDTMSIAMDPSDAARWFGRTPPDLSLVGRSRGPDFVYSFLRSFYEDDTKATGSNNLVLPGALMPDVLWQLQGIQKAVDEGDGHMKLELDSPGSLSPEDFDAVARDIANFLDYVGEPIRLERQSLGIRVIGFLMVLLLISYMLKREIWKDVE